MLKQLFQKLKDAVGGEEAAPATPVINERMTRISAGEAFAGPKRKVQNLTGGNRSLTPEQIRAIRHEAVRQRQEKAARETLTRVRLKLGKAKLEALAALPRSFDPAEATALANGSALTAEDLERLGEVVPGLDRDLSDDLARVSTWGEEERAKLLAAVPEAWRTTLGAPVVAILDRLPQLTREAVLRLQRVPQPAALAAYLAKESKFQLEEARAAAHALAQFGDEDRPSVMALPPPRPVKSTKPVPPRKA